MTSGINRISNGGIGKRDGVGVLAQGRRCVGVTKTRLGLQNLAALNKERRDVVTESMKTRALDAGTVGESRNAMPERSGRDSRSMVGIGTEQPDTELVLRCNSPLVLKAVPQRRGGRTDRERSIAPGLGRGDRVSRRGTTDVQNPATKITELQRDKFPASSAAVRRQPNEEQILFSKVAPLPVSLSATIVRDCLACNALAFDR